MPEHPRARRPSDIAAPVTGPARPSRALLGVAAALLSVLFVACGRSEAPPRSPFDDRGAAPTVPPGVTSYPPPFAPPALTPGPGVPVAPPGTPSSPGPGVPVAPPGTPSSPGAGDPEAATGAAIEVLAQRMAVAAARLSRVSVEPVDWPDACLGVSLPGIACAQVLTPGYRVVLRYDTGSTHEVHTGRGGLAVWAAQSTLHATVREAERAGAALSLTDASGRPASVLLGAGTQRLGAPAGSLKAGDRVTLGVDDPRDGGPLRAAWIARD